MEKPTNECFINLPYPNVVNASDRRKNVLEMIYRLYLSKFTAVAEYIYQNLIFSQNHPIAADLLECISLIEMKHFRILGKLLTVLGVDPRIKPADVNRRPKGSDSLSAISEQQLIDVAYNNIYTTKSFIQEFNMLSRITNDREIKTTVQRLMLDEQHVVDLLEELIM